MSWLVSNRFRGRQPADDLCEPRVSVAARKFAFVGRDAALEKGFVEVRVIHGKGTGTLRETVHALLRKSDRVEGFRLGDEGSGSWGATLVQLK